MEMETVKTVSASAILVRCLHLTVYLPLYVFLYTYVSPFVGLSPFHRCFCFCLCLLLSLLWLVRGSFLICLCLVLFLLYSRYDSIQYLSALSFSAFSPISIF